MLTHERRDELSYSVKLFGCPTFKSAFAFVNVTYSTIQNKCGLVQKFFLS